MYMYPWSIEHPVVYLSFYLGCTWGIFNFNSVLEHFRSASADVLKIYSRYFDFLGFNPGGGGAGGLHGVYPYIPGIVPIIHQVCTVFVTI
jgi:hypothetical protein